MGVNYPGTLGANVVRRFPRNSWRKCCAQIFKKFLAQISGVNFLKILGTNFARNPCHERMGGSFIAQTRRRNRDLEIADSFLRQHREFAVLCNGLHRCFRGRKRPRENLAVYPPAMQGRLRSYRIGHGCQSPVRRSLPRMRQRVYTHGTCA